jgi:hypothetical protein
MTYEFYQPGPKTKQLGSIRLGRKSSHIGAVSQIPKEELKALFTNGGCDFVRMFDGRWCELILVDWEKEENTWIHRALEPGQSTENKRILVLCEEGRPLHQYPRNVVPGSWYKIAIEDTNTGNILLRTFHNIPKETFEYVEDQSRSHLSIDGWFYIGGPKNGRPSTIGADKTFWLALSRRL